MAREEPLATEPGGLFPRLQQRFGLGRDPLAIDQPFFGGAQRQHSLETLRHLSGFGDLALLLTGERGCGKTRMLAELVRSESDKLTFHRLQPQELTSEQALAARLMAIAHKTLGNGQSAQDAVFGFFKWSEAATRKGRRLVLLLDDADHVPGSVLRILLGAHRNADTSHCAVPVLAGAEQILDLIGGIDPDDPAQTLLHRIDLRPLTRDELAEYLKPRLDQAGGDTSQLLSRSRLQQLHALSQGSLGRLKRIAPAVWLELAGASPQRRRTGKAISKNQILLPVLAVALLGSSWLVVSWQYDETSGNAVESASKNAADQPPVIERKIIRLGPSQGESGTVITESAAPDVNADSADAATATSESAKRTAKTPSMGGQVPPGSVKDSDQAKAAVSADNDNRISAKNDQVFLTPTEKSDIPTSSDTGKINDEGANSRRDASARSQAIPESSAKLSAGPDSLAGPDAKTQPIPQSEVGAQGVTNDGQEAPVHAKSAIETVKPLKEQASPQNPSVTKNTVAKDSFQPARPERFLPVASVRKRSGFTAQYVAGYEEKTAVSVLDQFPNVEGLVYTRSIHKGKPWYVVFYGQFASRSEANRVMQARSGTLDGLADRDRWVRSYAGF